MNGSHTLEDDTGSQPTGSRRMSIPKVSVPHGALSMPSVRQIKAGLLLTTFGALVLTVPLATFSVVSWWFAVASLLAFAGTVAWLRHSALSARRARTATPVMTQPATDRTSAATRPTAEAKTSTESARRDSARRVSARRDVVEASQSKRPSAAGSTAVTSQPSETSAARGGSSAVTAEPEVVSPLIAKDVTVSNDAVDMAPDVNAIRKAQDEVFDAGWAPVEVPRPTYTMKARVERPEVAPAPTVDELDRRPLAAQYANTPVSELPFDGMALDEDYDELPAVYRAS